MMLVQRPLRPIRSVLLGAGLVLASLLPAAPVGAQESLLMQVFPEAATLGAPAWVTVGTQAAWYVSGATVAQSRYQWVEDPNGTWEDPATGKKYRRTDESGEGTGSGAGDGYAILDVVALEGTQAVGSWIVYSIDRLAGSYTVAPIGGGRVPGAVVDGAWMHPDLLAKLVAGGFTGLQVLRGPYPLDGRTYDAVSLISNGAGSYQSWTWDLATGLLLVSSSRQDGAFSPFAAPGETPPQANSFLGYRQLVDVRQRTTPGIGTAPPDWVLGTGRLAYSGTWTFVNPMDPSSGAMVMPMTVEATFTEGGPTWANVRFRNVIDFSGVPNAAEGTNLATGAGSWWWDPTALAAMKRGQVLDEIPLLSGRVTVEDIVPWQGGSSVIVRTELPGNVVRAQFDVATGVLLGNELTQSAQGTTISVGLDQLP